MAIYFGIDVSKHQGTIDWKKVKNDGVQFAMIRASAGQDYIDTQLDENVSGCEKYGIDYGFYHYSYAQTVVEANIEADFFLSIIEKYSPTYPVAYDLEDKTQQQLGKETLTSMAYTFLDKMESRKYFSVLYTNRYWLQNLIYAERLARFDKWVADWTGNKPNYISYGMWQYSVIGSSEDVEKKWAVKEGKINGIDTAVDVNYSYKNYPRIIVNYGLNNYGTKYKVVAFKENLTGVQKDELLNKISDLGMTIETTQM